MTKDETAAEDLPESQRGGINWRKLVRYEIFAISWSIQLLSPLVLFMLHPLAPIVGVIWIIVRPVTFKGFDYPNTRLLAMTRIITAITLMMSASVGVMGMVGKTLYDFGVGRIWVVIGAYLSIALFWILAFLVPFPIRRELSRSS